MLISAYPLHSPISYLNLQLNSDSANTMRWRNYISVSWWKKNVYLFIYTILQYCLKVIIMGRLPFFAGTTNNFVFLNLLIIFLLFMMVILSFYIVLLTHFTPTFKCRYWPTILNLFPPSFGLLIFKSYSFNAIMICK